MLAGIAGAVDADLIAQADPEFAQGILVAGRREAAVAVTAVIGAETFSRTV